MAKDVFFNNVPQKEPAKRRTAAKRAPARSQTARPTPPPVRQPAYPQEPDESPPYEQAPAFPPAYGSAPYPPDYGQDDFYDPAYGQDPAFAPDFDYEEEAAYAPPYGQQTPPPPTYGQGRSAPPPYYPPERGARAPSAYPPRQPVNRGTGTSRNANRTQPGQRRAAAPAPRKRAAKNQAPAYAPAPLPKKKRHPIRKFFGFLLILLLVGAVGTAGLGVFAYKKIVSGYTPIAMKKSGVVDEASLMYSSSVYNLLLMGVDEADADSSTRSDSMILMSIDKVNHVIKLTTFMRDMYVEIPGYGQTKLNHACMYEGPQLTVDTIELNFGIRIDAYAKIGYDLFIELVNGVGGITVAEIDDVESAALAEEWVYKDPGKNIYLTGEEAIKYVRIRHWQSDFDRTERQREVITLIIEQAKKTPPKQLLTLAEKIASKIESTVPKAELMNLALSVLPCLSNGIAQQQIPADGTWSDDVKDSLMVLIVDFDANKEILKSFIYGG